MIRAAISAAIGLWLAACTMASPFVTIAPEPNNSAWWLRTKYHPSGKAIRGVPIRDIDPEWCAANEFKKELFPAGLLDSADRYDSLEGTGTAFAVTLNPTGTAPVTGVLGAFVTCDDRRGMFLLILNERSIPIFFDEFQKATFAVLQKMSEQRVDVWFCFECDNLSTLEWNANAAAFAWKSEHEDEE